MGEFFSYPFVRDGWMESSSRAHVDGILALMDCNLQQMLFLVLHGKSPTFFVKGRAHIAILVESWTGDFPETKPFLKLGSLFRLGTNLEFVMFFHVGVGGKHMRGPWNFGDRLLICSPGGHVNASPASIFLHSNLLRNTDQKA
jgi:hypothetical protein